jgi:beta-1,4-mannosyltransferase
MKVGYFPFRPGLNPYQQLFAGALEAAGLEVQRIRPRKWFPLQFACAQPVDVLHLDWPHDWYQGRTRASRLVKAWMYRGGLRRLRERPVVWTAHNLYSHEAHGHDGAAIAREHDMIQALVEVCDGIVVLSATAAAQLRNAYRVPASVRVRVVPHGHYIGCYANDVSAETARARLALPGAGRVLLFVGRLRPYKGLEQLIAAFADVAAEGSVLLIAGAASEDYAASLRRLIESAGGPGRIRLHAGEVADDDLQLYFNACDAVVLPFKDILNSGSLLLAMSFGCPVVAPRLGSIPEVACPTAWHAYAPADPDGLRGALRAALHGSSHGAASREAVRAFTASRYDWAHIGQAVDALYREIA